MRWSYLIPRLIVVGLIWGFVAYGMDPLLRYGGVQALESITGARADIGEVRTRFFPPTISLAAVAVARPGGKGRNIFEFDTAELKLEADSLSHRRLVVESGRIDGLRFDTERADDGQLDVLPEEQVDESQEPSWISEQITELGSGWLEGMQGKLREQTDPNQLETWRLGQDVYARWDVRFQELTARANEFEPRARQLKAQVEKARDGEPLQQVEQYLRAAQDAERLVRDAEQFRVELKEIVPEVRTDFAELNAARQRDLETVKAKLELLRPDPRRITEALIGRPMYGQIQELLTWVQAAQEFRQDLRQQTQPERRYGRDVEFALRQPAPDFLLKNLELSGVASIGSEPISFRAQLADVTEDPILLGRPCVFRLRGDGSRPLQLMAIWDATGEVPRAELHADIRDRNPVALRAGSPEQGGLSGTLSNLAWQADISLTGADLDGTVQLQANLDRMQFESSGDLRPEVSSAINEVLNSVADVHAKLHLGGTVRRPELELQSDPGEQIADGLKTAFTHQLEQAKTHLVAEINSRTAEQVQELKDRFAVEFDTLLKDNARLIEQANEVRTLVASLQSGRIDPGTLVRQATQSKLIPEDERRKMEKAMGGLGGLLQGRPAKPR